MDRFLQFQQKLENLMWEFNDLPVEKLTDHLEFYAEHYRQRKGIKKQ